MLPALGINMVKQLANKIKVGLFRATLCGSA